MISYIVVNSGILHNTALHTQLKVYWNLIRFGIYLYIPTLLHSPFLYLKNSAVQNFSLLLGFFLTRFTITASS